MEKNWKDFCLVLAVRKKGQWRLEKRSNKRNAKHQVMGRVWTVLRKCTPRVGPLALCAESR